MDKVKRVTFDDFSFIVNSKEEQTESVTFEDIMVNPIVDTTPPILNRSSFIFELRDIMKEHALTLEQAVYLLASLHNIDWEISGADALALVNKGLIHDNKVNQTLLFRSRPAIQGTLDLNFETKPRGNDETMRIAHNLEIKLVPGIHLTNEYKKAVADEYFKGDLTVARYFIIFRHLFPVRDIKANINWNKHFGYSYNGITLWDSHIRVAKKFHEIYRKKDIGLFLSGAYYCVLDTIDLEKEKCFMTKPYKFLLAFEPWYEVAKEHLEEKEKEKVRAAALLADNEQNKTQAL